MHVSIMKVLLVNTWDHIQAEVEAPQMEALDPFPAKGITSNSRKDVIDDLSRMIETS